MMGTVRAVITNNRVTLYCRRCGEPIRAYSWGGDVVCGCPK